MRQIFTNIIASALILSFIGSPVFVIAQTTGNTSQVLQRFNPNATLQTNGRSFSGLSFSGVGGAIAGCTNIGGAISGGIGAVANIFKSKTPTTTNTRPPSSLGNANAISASNASGASSPAATLPGTRDLSKPSIGVSNVSSALNSGVSAGLQEAVPVIAKKTDEELTKLNKREQCLNGVAYAVAKSLLQQVTDKTLSWVNTGFDGNPLYVRDIDSFMRSISNQQVARFIDQIPNQDPVFGNTLRSIVTEQVSGISDGLINKGMNTPEAIAYQNFQEDFRNGGWAAFLNPENNVIDAVFNAGERLDREIGTQQENTSQALQRNSGFLDLNRCVEYADEKKPTYPYTYKGFACPTDVQKAWDTHYENCLKIQGAPASASCRLAATQAYDPIALSSCISAVKAAANENKPRQCVRYETVTPGSIIAAQVSEVTTSPIRQLEQADQINEVLGAFFDQLLNRLITNGLASLRGRSSDQFTFTGIGSNVVLSTNGAALQGTVQSGMTALGYQQAGSGYNGDFDVSRPQHLRAVLQTQYDYLNRLRDARSALNRIVPTVGALDYCIPGPNAGWRNGLEENAANFFAGLQVVQPEGQNTAGGVGTAISAAGGVASVIPGGQLVGGIASAVGGLITGLFGGGKKPDTIAATNQTFFDKVTGKPVSMSQMLVFRARNRSIEFISNNIGWRWEELMKRYNELFTQEKIAVAFMNADPQNATFARGFVATAFEETEQLPQYATAAIEIDTYYESAEQETLEAIRQLERIRSEANQIVSTARARHIAAQAAAGTPVNLSCLNNAYVMDTTAITPTPRQESSAVSPLFQQFIDANNYFYSTL